MGRETFEVLAANLVARLGQRHQSIRDWECFRYDALPDEVAPHRTAFERMIIRDLAITDTN